MERIIAGVHQFTQNHFEQQREFFEHIARSKQRPQALFITCSDSRINPNLITQTEPGELFIVRNAGNIVPPYGAGASGEAGTIEFAISVLGIRDVIICGHAGCGAVQGLLHEEMLAELPALRAWLAYAGATRHIVKTKYANLEGAELATAAGEENVLVQLNNLSTHPSVAALLAAGELQVFGWYYDIGAGRISQFDQAVGRFVAINGAAQPALSLPVRSAVGHNGELHVKAS